MENQLEMCSCVFNKATARLEDKYKAKSVYEPYCLQIVMKAFSLSYSQYPISHSEDCQCLDSIQAAWRGCIAS